MLTYAVGAALMMNIYIVGLNQLSEIEIDKLPQLRWKRFALVAAMCILAVRAVIVQLAFYLHIQTHVLSRAAVFSKPLIFATAFMSFFSVVIALFKNIPDIEGDKIFGIKSYTVRLGQERMSSSASRVFWTCISLLEMAYGVSVLVGATSSYTWSNVITVLGHSILAAVLWIRVKSVDLKSKAALTSCYSFIWKLFYAEYLLIPLIR
ncbi:homogentisate phytyltransferase 1, chloroplastic-like [Hibiscus syriacus]|uniref:homogentisate phytyltransferase 1, chloroplastic-like n=1 Tax=Hibiscus syriacus TaxID=106335 RepID=UPI0019229F66|nr:homogentisate phytyltransferase 1, chloroplastic-like [Hibiscus syriacus]